MFMRNVFPSSKLSIICTRWKKLETNRRSDVKKNIDSSGTAENYDELEQDLDKLIEEKDEKKAVENEKKGE